METGRIIHKRYLLQRLIQQGQASAVYQGFDQVLQRAVVLKITSAEHVAAYRAAIRATSQFAHPNIVGIYDLIIEPEMLYIVQEYVEGDDFGTLLQSQLSPYAVIELGMQICQALIYAGTPSRKVCHGDLTPASIVRDRRGSVRVNNFALPSDLAYFQAWSVIGGGNNEPLSDTELPFGQASPGRHSDDTRAIGLLMYQLLSGRDPNARMVEPPSDGRLRFSRNSPTEICDTIARTVIRQHPQYIATPDVLYAELKALAEIFEPAPPAVAATANKIVLPQQFASSRKSGSLSSQPLSDPAYSSVGAYDGSMTVPADAAMNVSSKLVAARQAAYASAPGYSSQPALHRTIWPMILLIGLVMFALFFAIGYYLSTVLLK